jgi:membrane protein
MDPPGESASKTAHPKRADRSASQGLMQSERPHWFAIVKRTAIGTWSDGFVHAGNLAYVTLFAVFPFLILGAAVFSALGERTDRAVALSAVLSVLPPSVQQAIGPVAREVIDLRTGWLLWASCAFALWTMGSLVETIRDILRRAYGTKPAKHFWHHRLTSMGIVAVSVIFLVLSLFIQVLIGAAEETIGAWSPNLTGMLDKLLLSRVVPAITIYLSVFLLFISLTPATYRGKQFPKWPGSLLVALWWVGVTVMFPRLLRAMITYNLTYGSLAGIMITLFFFWLIGLGMVAGAELNAALARTPKEAGPGDADANEQEEAAQ